MNADSLPAIIALTDPEQGIASVTSSDGTLHETWCDQAGSEGYQHTCSRSAEHVFAPDGDSSAFALYRTTEFKEAEYANSP